jgi:hypothetical protein
MWLNVLFDPLVLSWILFCYINSYLGSSSSNYIDVFPIIHGFYRNPLEILVILVLFFLNISQECWAIFYVMVYYETIHKCHGWKWKIPCIISWLLEVVAYESPFSSYKYSSSSTYTYESTSIYLRCIVLGYLVILRKIILWMSIVVLRLCGIEFWWHIVELR